MVSKPHSNPDLDSLNFVFKNQEYPSNVSALLSAGKILLRLSLDSAKSNYRLATRLAKEGSVLQAESFSYEGVCWAFLGFSDSASHRLSKALRIAKEHDNYDLITKIYGNMGINFSISSQYDSALLLFQEFSDLAKKENNETDIATAANNIGLLLLNKGSYYKALSRFVEAEYIFFNQKDTSKISSVYLNIAIIHRDLENYDESILYSRKSITIKEAIEDKRGLMNTYVNLAAVFNHKDMNDSVEFYLDRADPLAKETDDLISQISVNYTRMRLYSESNRADLSIPIGIRSIELMKDDLDNLELLSRIKIELGRAYAYQSKLRIAQEMVSEGLEISLANDLAQVSVSGFEVQSIIQSASGNYFEAFQSHKKYMTLSDSINNTKKSKLMSELEVEFKTEQKERKIIEQDLEIVTKKSAIEEQRTQIGLLATSIIIILLVGFGFYLMSRNKQKLLLQRSIASERENGFKAIITATEEERKRIAKDLHDGVVQQIAAVKLTLARVEKRLPKEEREEIVKAKNMAEAAAEETRNLSHQMMPKILMEVGLVPAMEEVINNLLSVNNMTVDFQQHGLKDRYDNRIEIAVYRIFQELVNNVVKHSQAKNVDVQLMESGGKLMLIVEDDGVGMKKEKNDGIGLSNIKSRLTTIDGKVDYASGETSGTVATIVIPL
jgi:signal transduction histidine kinase